MLSSLFCYCSSCTDRAFDRKHLGIFVFLSKWSRPAWNPTQEDLQPLEPPGPPCFLPWSAVVIHCTHRAFDRKRLGFPFLFLGRGVLLGHGFEGVPEGLSFLHFHVLWHGLLLQFIVLV